MTPSNKTFCQLSLLAMLFINATASSSATTLQLEFTAPSSFNESNRQATLQWNAEPGKTYLVQSDSNLASGAEWKTEEPVRAAAAGPIRWMAPESLGQQKYYRLVLPQPEVFSVEPALVNSSDPGALLYLYGQCLPTNGSVVINGQNYTPVSVDANGAWVAISLNGLPPGTPIVGSILVLNNASNIVTTLPIQTPMIYGTEMTAEQLQGPPDEPPVSPSTRHRGHVTVLKAADTDSDGQADRSVDHRGHVTVLKSHDGSIAGNSAAGTRVRKGMQDIKNLAAPAAAQQRHRGHVTVLKSHEGGDGSEVIAATGELQCDETDLAIAGRGLDFVWTRSYRSRTGPTTAQGAGWDFSYNVSLSLQPDGTAQLRSGNGRTDTFYADGTNGWVRNEHFIVIGDPDNDGIPELVTFPDTGKWLFHPPGTAASGKLSQIVDRNGNTIRCEYDAGSGRLLRVVDTLDRTNTVAYNPVGLIQSVTDFSGRTVSYEYDGNGDLTASVSPAVTGTPNGNDFPGGKTNRYTYSSGFADARLNHNLITCTDAKGQTWLTVAYHATNNPASLDFDAADYLLRGIEKEQIKRGMVNGKAGSPPRMRAIVNDGVGNVSEAYYDSHHRLVELQEFTGRADPALPTTETENRPTGKLRLSDPDLYVTRWEWNADSLCTRVVYPNGNSTELVYERAFNQNAARSNRAHAGDLRVLREVACCDQDDDGDGLTDTLVSTFEYDPRFGSSAMAFRALTGRGTVATGRIETGRATVRGWDWTDKSAGRDSAKVITDRDTGRSKGFGFVTLATDPRGIITTANYDTNGNLTVCTRNIREISIDELNIEAFAYNSHGQLTTITNASDGNGYRRVDTFSYYTNGPQTGYLQQYTQDLLGHELAHVVQQSPRGRITSITDPRGNDWLYEYNQLDQCVRRQTPKTDFGSVMRYATEFQYDANNNVVRVDEDNRDADGNLGTNAVWRTQYVYDALDRMVGCWRDKKGNLVLRCDEVQYDANDNVTLYRSGEAVNGNNTNAVVQFLFDERDLLLCRIDAPGTALAGANEGFFDLNRNLVAVQTTANSGPDKAYTAVYEYDGLDRLVRATDAMSNVVSYVYDRNGNLTSARCDGQTNDVAGDTGNRRLSETRITYDGLDRPQRAGDSFFDIFTEVSISDGESTGVCTYAPNGQLLTSTDDNGRTTRYTYDTAGRLASVIDPKTNIVSYAYDACNNVLSVTQTDRSDVTGGTQQFSVVHTYDNLHRLTRSVDNVGNTNLYAYDSRDNLVRTTDPKGNDTCYFYDGLNRCTDTISYVGPCDASPAGITINTSHVEYNDNDRVTAATDSNGNTTLYTYDARDRCVLVTEADGTSRSLVWSPRSNLLSEQDANGTTITNTYDLCDRVVHRAFAAGGGVLPTTTFEAFAYDGLSRLVAATNDVSVTTFAYDSLGNCVSQSQDGLTTLMTHDGEGNRLAMTYPGGRVVSYTYNALNEVATCSSSTGGSSPVTLATLAYDGPGRMGRMTRANNVNTRYQWNGLVSPPNAAEDFGWMQVRGVNHQGAGNGPIVDQRVAAYDRSQNRTTRAQTAPFYVGGDTLTNAFDYDALDRLRLAIKTKGTSAQRIDYTLDGNGNRLAVAVDLVAEPYIMDNTFPDPADFQMNQYTLTPAGIFQYDANGNRAAQGTAVGQVQYQYDYADRLVAVTDLSSGVPVTVATFEYDALGRRIRKHVYPSLPCCPETTQFIYGGGENSETIIEERVQGILKRTYAFPHVFDQKGRIMFTDTGDTLYCHDDDLGNALALTAATGAVVERYEYDDFGAVSFLTSDGLPNGTGTSSVGYLYCWGGQQVDPETGLHNGGGGDYYDPQMGRAVRGKVKSVRDMGVNGFADNNPWSSGGAKAQDHNSSRSNKSSSRAQDHNSSRSNKSDIAAPGGGGSKAQDHNSSRSNKSGLAGPGSGGGGGGFLLKKEEGGRHTPFHNKYRPQFRKILDYGEAGGMTGQSLGKDKNMNDVVAKKF